jgi:hypothetical protein
MKPSSLAEGRKEVEIREGKTMYKPLKTVKKTLDTAVYGLFTFSFFFTFFTLHAK